MIRSHISYSLLIVLLIFVLSSSLINMVALHAKKTSDTNDTNMQETQGLPDSGQKAIRNLVPSSAETVTNTEQTRPNDPPRADAGNNKIVKESEKVQLDGSNSIDPDGDKLSYRWQLLSPKNVNIKLDNDESTKPDFVAPSLDGTENKLTLVFKLTVSDGAFDSSDIVKILVTAKNNENGNDDDNKLNTVTVIDRGSPY